MKRILVVGTVAYDEIETPSESSGKILGGAGTYIGLSASIFNINQSIISIVGGDFDQKYLNLLKSKGKYHKDWNKRDTISTELNVLADFNPKLNDDQKKSEIIVLGNLHPLVQSTVLNQLNSENKCVILDTMNFWMDNALEELHDVIARVDVIIINDEEAIQLSGKENLFTAAQEIMTRGPSHIVIKKGEHGAMLFSKTEFFTTPAFPVQDVKDPTGAGDCFAGGFAGFLAQCEDINFQNLKTAVVHGTINASFCVEGFGTSSIQKLNKEKAQDRFKEFKSFTRY